MTGDNIYDRSDIFVDVFFNFANLGYTPLSIDSPDIKQTGIVKKTSVTDVMRRLLQPKNILMSAPTKKGCYVSLLNIIQGEVDPSEVI